VYQLPHDPTAVQGRRIGAWLIDFVFASVLAIIAFNLAVDIYEAGSGNRCSDDGDPPSAEEMPFCSGDLLGTDGYFLYDENTDESVFIEGGVWAPVGVFVGYGVLSFVLVEGIVGGSIGKLIVGLRVVTAAGRPAGIGRSMVRFGLWLVDFFPYCFPLVGLITGLTTRGHRRVGDMAAGTFVVPRTHVGQAVAIPGLNAPASMAYAMTSSPTPYVPPAAAPWGTPGPGPAWGPSAPASPWDTPTTGVTPPTPSTAEASKPQWDADRNTYIQWDVYRNAWLQWDTDAGEWRSID
jgi:uncharacterized RDD family membrane protein YckC